MDGPIAGTCDVVLPAIGDADVHNGSTVLLVLGKNIIHERVSIN